MESLFKIDGDWIPIYAAVKMFPGRGEHEHMTIRSLRNKIYLGQFPTGTVTKSFRGVWFFRKSYIMGLMERGGRVIAMYSNETKQTA